MKLVVESRRNDAGAVAAKGNGKVSSAVLDGIRDAFLGVFQRELAIDSLVEMADEDALLQE